MPSIRTAIAISVFFYGVYAATSVWLYVLGRFGFRLDPSTAFLIKQVASWLATLFVSRRVAKVGWSDCYPLKGVDPRIVAPIVLASMGASVVLADIASWIPMPEWFQEAIRESLGDNPSAFVAIVVVAPVAEEFFFRGWMLRGFLNNYTARKAIFASATIFALFHLNPWQAVAAFPLGIASAWLVLRTGSLVPSILSHAVVNGTGRVAEPILGRFGYGEEMLTEMGHFPLPLLVGGVVLLLVGGWWLYHDLSVKRAVISDPAT